MIAAALLIAALAAPVAAPAADRPTVVTRFAPPARLTVGDRFEVAYVLRTRHPSLITGPLADSLGAFLMVGEKRSTDRRRQPNSDAGAGDVDQTTCRVSFACFAPGRQRLPPLAFLISADRAIDTLRTDTVAVNVASVLPANMKDIHGLKPPETFPNLLLWIIPAIIVALALLAYYGRRLYRRLRTGTDAETPPLPPWDEALAALDALPWRDWLADGQAKRYYYALSEILKRYIERRFEFDAVEQTTTELLASMRALKLPMRDDIGRFFARYDLVKYAKWVPPLEESEQALTQVRAFVERTRPAEPAPDAAAAEPPQSGAA